MKKILSLLILLPLMAISQTVPADATALENIQITNNTTSLTAPFVTVQETNGVINKINKADLVNVVEVNDVPSLPLVGNAGKIYVVKNLNKIYRWNSTFYQELAVTDISGKVDKVTGKSLILDSEITRLSSVQTGATANSTDAQLRDRTTHTGEQAISTVTGLQTELDGKQSSLGFTPENIVNKVTSIGASPTNINYPSELAVKTYADNLVVGMLNDRGSWDASVNVFPTTGGSGTSGAIRKGDMWYVSVAGVLGGKEANIGDSFRALVNSPAQVSGSWSVLEANVGYVPANDANVVHLTGNETIAGVKTFYGTPIINKLVTVTNKGQYYDLLKNGVGSTRVVDQVNVWNGSAYAISNNGIFSGDLAGQNNTGNSIGSISGSYAGQNNTGNSIGSISGSGAGQNNTGNSIGSISGSGAGRYNTGNSIGSISGSYAGQNNTGNSIGSISGDIAGQNNTGNSIGSISGSYAGRYNTGNSIGSISGSYAGQNNTGNSIGSISGYAAGQYNEGSNNIIGHNSHSSFLDNVSGTKTVSSIDIASERITITAHGFGPNSSYVNLRYTTTGTAIGGLSNNNIYQVQIIDANTIFFRVNNLTSEGSGTHTFTPQFKLNNVNVLGNSVNPTASNQTIIGNSSSTQFIAYGKHLVNTTIDNGIDQLQVNGTISATPATLSNQVVIKSQLDLKADLSSPMFAGTPTAPTATSGTNTTQIATTAFVAGGLATKENTFSKNTAFNKNFGTASGTVAEGNDGRINNGQTAFSWGNHAGLYPTYNGTGATGTWGINISGSAQGLGTYNWNPTVKDNADYMFGRNSANEIAIISQLGVRTFLDLGSNAYTSTPYLPLSGGALTGIVTAPTATAGTNTTQIATTAFVQSNSRPYKVYTALLSQSGTNAPVATVLENTLGGSIVWARSTDGIYYATSGYRFTDNKTTVFINNHRQDSNVAIECTNNNNVSVSTYGTSTVPFSGVDGRLLNNAIEIRVYPSLE